MRVYHVQASPCRRPPLEERAAIRVRLRSSPAPKPHERGQGSAWRLWCQWPMRRGIFCFGLASQIPCEFNKLFVSGGGSDVFVIEVDAAPGDMGHTPGRFRAAGPAPAMPGTALLAGERGNVARNASRFRGEERVFRPQASSSP